MSSIYLLFCVLSLVSFSHIYLTLQLGVSIDVACYGYPSSSVLSGSLAVHEAETSPFLLDSPCLPSTMPSIRSRCKESCFMICKIKTIVSQFERCRTMNCSFLKIVTPLRLRGVLSSLFLEFASVFTFQRLLGEIAIIC